jgi:hypothetical protein
MDMDNAIEHQVPANAEFEMATASDRAYSTLLDMIVTRVLPTGAVLREQRLAKIACVSRTPLREALNRLEGEGLVVRQANRGLVVKPITVRDYIEALHVPDCSRSKRLLVPSGGYRRRPSLTSARGSRISWPVRNHRFTMICR